MKLPDKILEQKVIPEEETDEILTPLKEMYNQELE